MLALKDLGETPNQENLDMAESAGLSPSPEDIAEEIHDQTENVESEVDSENPQVADVQANKDSSVEDTLDIDRKEDTLDNDNDNPNQEQRNLDQKDISVQDLCTNESDVDIDYFWSLDTITAKKRKAFENNLHLHAWALKAQGLEKENIMLHEQLKDTQTMFESLRQRIKEMELEMTKSSSEHNVVSRLQDDLQNEREQHIFANNRLSDLMHELACKETQLVVEREKASHEISALKTEVSEAQNYTKELQNSLLMLSSNEAEMLCVTEMNLNLKSQNALLEQDNLELSAKLQQVETKLHLTETSQQNLQKKVEELEFELADSSSNHNTVVTGLQQDLQKEREQLTFANKKVSDLMEEIHHKETELVTEREKASQEKSVLIAEVNEALLSVKELQRSLSMLSTLEAEVYQVKEMKLELKTQNTLLEQKILELSSELNQVKTKQVVTEESVQHFLCECDSLKEKIRELQSKQTGSTTNSNQNQDLHTNSAVLVIDNHNVSELLQQFALVPMHEDESSSSLRERQQSTIRNEESMEELQQQVTTTSTNNAVVNYLLQQLNHKESECRKAKEDLISHQKANQNMKKLLHSISMKYERTKQKYIEAQMKIEDMSQASQKQHAKC